MTEADRRDRWIVIADGEVYKKRRWRTFRLDFAGRYWKQYDGDSEADARGAVPDGAELFDKVVATETAKETWGIR